MFIKVVGTQLEQETIWNNNLNALEFILAIVVLICDKLAKLSLQLLWYMKNSKLQ